MGSVRIKRMDKKELIVFAREEIQRISRWLANAEYHWNVFTRNMEGGELREYKERCQEQENIMYILEDWLAQNEDKENGT